MPEGGGTWRSGQGPDGQGKSLSRLLEGDGEARVFNQGVT